MQFMVLILNKVECMPTILCRLLEAGIKGATTTDCQGGLSLLSESSIEPPPIFGSLRRYLNPEHKHTKMLMLVLPSEQILIARDIINDAVGGLENPDTGILFTLPVMHVEGLAN